MKYAKILTAVLASSAVSLMVTPAQADSPAVKPADWIYINTQDFMLTPTRRLERNSLCQAVGASASGENMWNVSCHVPSVSANACEIINTTLELDPESYKHFNFLDLRTPLYSVDQVSEAAHVDLKLNKHWGHFDAGELVIADSTVLRASSFFGFKDFYASLSDQIFVKDTNGCWTNSSRLYKLTNELPPVGPQLGQKVVYRKRPMDGPAFVLTENTIIGFQQSRASDQERRTYALASNAAVPLSDIFWNRNFTNEMPAHLQDTFLDYETKRLLKVDDLLGQGDPDQVVFFDARSAKWYFLERGEYHDTYAKLSTRSNKFNLRSGDFIVNGKVQTTPAPNAEKISYIDDEPRAQLPEEQGRKDFAYLVTESEAQYFVFPCDETDARKGLCVLRASAKR